MAEIEKAIVEETKTPQTEEVDIELESDDTEESPSLSDVVDAVDEFFKNIAEDMSEDVLQRIDCLTITKKIEFQEKIGRHLTQII